MEDQSAESAEHAVAAQRDERQLINSARRWLNDALDAWASDDYSKVAVVAPLAVEHLGKAVLWRTNPVLVVPLSADAEASLFSLATQPDLTSPRLRTVGLKILLSRLDQLLGGLPVEARKRNRMVDTRNGAMHVGTPTQSRHVLIDCLTLIGVFVDRLGLDQDKVYGEHLSSIAGLLDENRTEVGHRVAAKQARARQLLQSLKNRLSPTLFKETSDRLEEVAADALDAYDFGKNAWGIDTACPVCGMKGRLFGHVEADPEVDYDIESLGGGEYDASPYIAGWTIELSPEAFSCNVCRLTLHGPQELNEVGLPSAKHEIEMAALGEHFDPDDLYRDID